MSQQHRCLHLSFTLVFTLICLLAGGYALAGNTSDPVASGSAGRFVGDTGEVANFVSQPWQLEIVDMPGYFQTMSDRSLRFDSAGQAHMVYGGDRLYYAIFDGSEWQVEIVDESVGTGVGASLDLDASDRPHISYLDQANGALKYAHWNGSTWIRQVLDKASNTNEERTAIAVDDEGRPHIAYRQLDWQGPPYCPGLGYAYWTGSEWQIERFGECGGRVSLALDSAGAPHITFGDDGITHATKQAGNWSTTVVGPGFGSSVAVDSQDRPHVVYVDAEYQSSGQLIYAYWDGSDWVTQSIQPAEWGVYLSLTLDDSDTAHIAYGSEYIQLNGNGAEVVNSPSSIEGSYSSIALDGDGHPAISYLQSWGRYLYCRRWDGAEWITDLVDHGASSGLENSLAVDEKGEPHFSYYSTRDAGWAAINYAHRISETWVTETITYTYMPSLYHSGYDTSIAVDGNDAPHVSFWYSDYYSDGLYYGHRDGEAWQMEMIADDADGPSELAVDSQDRPHIAFVDNQALKYGYRSAGGWSIGDVDTGVESHVVALALDGADRPRIVYVERITETQVLKYAAWTGTSWTLDDIQVIEPGEWGSWIEASLALDAAGNPNVAYEVYDEWEEIGELKYANKNGDIWAAESVDTRRWGIGAPSILVGGDGIPTIVFAYDGVELATRNDGAWHIQQAFGTGRMANHLSAVTDGRSLFLSYRDTWAQGLVFAGPKPLTEHLYLPAVTTN